MQLNFSQLHINVHAVYFKLFYCCTPIKRVDYEVNTHAYARVLFMSEVHQTYTFDPSSQFFNTAQAIHTYIPHQSFFHTIARNEYFYTCRACAIEHAWILEACKGHSYIINLSCTRKHVMNISILVSFARNCTHVRSSSLNRAILYFQHTNYANEQSAT